MAKQSKGFPSLGSMGEKCVKKATPQNKNAPGPTASKFGKTGSGKSIA